MFVCALIRLFFSRCCVACLLTLPSRFDTPKNTHTHRSTRRRLRSVQRSPRPTPMCSIKANRMKIECECAKRVPQRVKSAAPVRNASDDTTHATACARVVCCKQSLLGKKQNQSKPYVDDAKSKKKKDSIVRRAVQNRRIFVPCGANITNTRIPSIIACVFSFARISFVSLEIFFVFSI